MTGIRYHCRATTETMRARIPHGTHSGVRSSALCRHDMVRFCISAAKQEELRITVRTGLEAIQGGVFFGKRLRALELNLLRPKDRAHLHNGRSML